MKLLPSSAMCEEREGEPMVERSTFCLKLRAERQRRIYHAPTSLASCVPRVVVGFGGFALEQHGHCWRHIDGKPPKRLQSLAPVRINGLKIGFLVLRQIITHH